MGTSRTSKSLLEEAINALAACNGNRTKAARFLGIPGSTFRGRLEQAKKAGFPPVAIMPTDGKLQKFHADSPQKFQEAIDAFAKCGTKYGAANALGLEMQTYKYRLKMARENGYVASVAPAQNSPVIIQTESNKQTDTKPTDVQPLYARIKKLEDALKSYEQQAEQPEIIKGIIGEMSRQVEELEAPTWVVTNQGKASSPGVPTLFISDLHWGEVVYPSQINNVNKYNIKIAHERMQTLVDSAVHLLKIISPKMDYPGIVVPLGGDMISGNIHDELTATNEINSMPAVLDLYGVLVGTITALANTFGRVFLPCVSGNHGRDTKKIWNKDRHATSFDWLIYRFLAKHFENDKRITFFIPDGPDAYYKVYNHAYLLTHGDQFRGGDGIIGVMGPIIRGDTKKRSRNSQIDMDYDTLLLGHFHQYVHHRRFIINGSLKGLDEYAYNNNFGFEPPQQALWLTHPKYSITYRMPVYVDRKRAAAKTEWVSVPR